MPSRRLALVGAPRGPVVCIHRVVKPQVKVCGLPEGDFLIVKVDADEPFEVHHNGLHTLEREGTWVQVFTGSGKRIRDLIVEIISKAA